MSSVKFKHHKTGGRGIAGAFATGQKLELSSSLELMRELNNATHFSNLNIKLNDKYTAIDLVVIIGNNVFIGEMKNYNKSIVGSLHDKTWVASTRRTQFNIPNPIVQNLHHSIALSKALQEEFVYMSEIMFNEYVIVPDSCEIKVDEHIRKIVVTNSEWKKILTKCSGEVEVTNDTLLEVMNSWRKIS